MPIPPLTIDSPTSQPTKHYRYLDGWRGLSIIAVLMGHYLSLPVINTGRLGVEMFFVLSGRLMAEILFVKKAALPTFFKRRISRVYPVFILFICTMWAVFGNASGALHLSSQAAVACLTFTYNYLHSYFGESQVVDHVWSLCIEEHVYIVLGLMAYLSRKYKLDAAKCLSAVALIFMLNGAFQTLYLGLDYYDVYWRSDTRGASIIISVVIYLLFQQRAVKAPGWIPILFFVLAAALNIYRVPDPVKYSLGTVCLAVSINTLSTLPAWAMRILSNSIIVWTGLISFSLYLWQQPFYKLIGVLPGPALLAIAIICAIASYQLIEVPARRYLNERWVGAHKTPKPA
ncbi:MAG TPA: acyltransferase [Methylophilaceae bacterium]|jgi:peptidoglycan/LPS O-acetylase OafA/YrhL